MQITSLDGLILESKFVEYILCVKGPIITNWQDGYPRQEPKHIEVKFMDYICILDDVMQDNEWTPEDKDFIRASLERHLNNKQFTDMWVHEAPKPPKPWPKYNSTHHNQIPVIAEATGTVAEALAYEERGRDGEPRPGVVAKLREILANGSAAEAAEVDEELAAV